MDMKLSCGRGDDSIQMMLSWLASAFQLETETTCTNTYVLIVFTLFRSSCEKKTFIKSAPLSSRVLVFDAYVETCSKKDQQLKGFVWFVLGHVGPSSAYLGRWCRALRANAALFAKYAPLSMTRRARKPFKKHKKFDRFWKRAPLCNCFLGLLGVDAPRRP